MNFDRLEENICISKMCLCVCDDTMSLCSLCVCLCVCIKNIYIKSNICRSTSWCGHYDSSLFCEKKRERERERCVICTMCKSGDICMCRSVVCRHTIAEKR